MSSARPDGGRLAGRTTVRSRDLRSVRERTSTPERPGTDDALDWSWPPYAPLEDSGQSFDTPDWAPASSVWHPRLRVGRWAFLYRRSA